MKNLSKILISILFLGLFLIGCTSTSSNDMLYKYLKNNKYGFVDSKGNIVVEAIYDKVNNFSDGLAAVMKDEKLSFIDLTGNIQFDISANYISNFESCNFIEGRCAIGTDTGYSLIDREGNIVTNKKYDYIHNIANGFAIYRDDSTLYGLMTLDGEEVLEDKYAFLQNFSDGLIAFKDSNSGNYGYINEYGVVIIEPTFKEVKNFINGIALVKDTRYNDAKWFTPINKEGEIVTVETHYPSVLKYSDSTYLVSANYKLGFIDDSGETIIDTIYDFSTNVDTLTHGFSEGLAAVRVDKGVGFINKQNEMIIPPQFDGIIENFNNDIAIVTKDDKWLYINKDGEILFEININDD